MKLTPALATMSVALLALVGCSNTNDEPQSREEAQQQYADELESQGTDPMEGFGPMKAGEFEVYTMDGGHVTFDLPADPNSEELAAIEEYREDVSADPVTYLIADVDNRDGTDSINMYQVTAFDQDGTSYEFSGISEYISDIAPSTDWDSEDGSYLLPDGTRLPREQGFDLYNQSIDLHNEHLHGASPAERKTMILVHEGDDLPDEFTRVAVWPNGAFEEVEAYPVE